jgi:hypothetical protein
MKSGVSLLWLTTKASLGTMHVSSARDVSCVDVFNDPFDVGSLKMSFQAVDVANFVRASFE